MTMAERPIAFPGEEASNEVRRQIARLEPRALRTFTPTLAVLARSAGIFHWTPDGRRLYDYSSGVLVANLGHNPRPWLNRLGDYLGWTGQIGSDGPAYLEAVPLTAYNAVTEIEAEACARLVGLMRARPGGGRMEQVLWAASGSEAIQKALWAALHRDRARDMILATRDGFHGKKGIAGAVTGNESSPERDPRVRFIGFPRDACMDVTLAGRPFDTTPCLRELDALQRELGPRLAALITEPYLGGAGAFHPPAEYLRALEAFCRRHDILFILDEVQANFGRTGAMFAYETYGLEPDIVVLGKGLGNGAPVSAAVGRGDVFASLDYGEGSDTYSGNPIACAAVLATLDLYEANDVIGHARRLGDVLRDGLLRLKQIPFVKHVRGEAMVWGVEMTEFEGQPASDIANACVRACYVGEPGRDGIHLLGPLAGCVLRVSPPLVISEAELRESLELLYRIFTRLADDMSRRSQGSHRTPAAASH